MENEPNVAEAINHFDGKIFACFICGGDAEVRLCESYAYLNWSLECGTSLFKVLNLDPYLKSVFHCVNYCQLCLQNNREIDFLFRAIQNLERQLDHFRCVVESSIRTRVINSFYPVDPLGHNEPSLSDILRYVRQEYDKTTSIIPNELRNTRFQETVETEAKDSPVVDTLESTRMRLVNRMTRLRNSRYLQSINFGRILSTPIESSSKVKKMRKNIETDVKTKVIKIYCSYPDCNFVCQRESRLNIHIRKIHLEESTPYHCDHSECGRKFRILRQLLVHVKVHRNRLQFKKSPPGKYRQPADSHFSKKKQPKKKCKFRCFQCPEKFNSRKLCTSHIELVHGVLGSSERVIGDSTQSMDHVTEIDHHTSSNQDCLLKTVLKISENEKEASMTDELKKFHCSYPGCKFLCRQEARLNIHYRKIHLEEATPYHCDHVGCEKKFSIQKQLFAHVKFHTNRSHLVQRQKKITTTTSFSGNPASDDHDIPISNQIWNARKSFACLTENCRRSFRSKAMFDLHLRKCHEKDPNPYQCFACSEKFETAQLRTTHVKDVHSQSLEMYGQRNRANIFMNNPKVLPSKLNPQLSCVECGFPFVNGDDSNLEIHLGLHKTNEMENRKFACVLPNCVKEYVNSFHLKRHVTTEHAIIGVKCDLCDQILSNLTSLRRHCRTFHCAAQAIDELVCGECSYQSRTKKDLSDHMTKHSKIRQFQCNLCPETFKWRQSLRTHLIKHAPPETWPYKCTFTGCEKRFHVSSKLKTHEESHGATRSYVCQHCSNAFKTQRYLMRHIHHVHVKMSWKTSKL